MAISMHICRVSLRRCLHTRPRTAFGLPIVQNLAVPISSTTTLDMRTFSTSQGVQAGSAGKHWYAERVAAVGLLALIPSGFIYPNPVVDYGLAVLIPLHGHWGYMAVVEDYAPEVLKGAGKFLVYLLTAGAFTGLMYLNIRDVGICAAVKGLWSL